MLTAWNRRIEERGENAAKKYDSFSPVRPEKREFDAGVRN